MKEIINGKLYDTEKSEKICDIEITGHSLWRTAKGTLFLVNDVLIRISNTDQEKIKEILGKNNPEKYIELFGEVEEA